MYWKRGTLYIKSTPLISKVTHKYYFFILSRLFRVGNSFFSLLLMTVLKPYKHLLFIWINHLNLIIILVLIRISLLPRYLFHWMFSNLSNVSHTCSYVLATP